MQKISKDFPCGLFSLDHSSNKWVPICQNKVLITFKESEGEGIGFSAIDETTREKILEGETYNNKSWSRASEMFVSILATTMKSYGLHCLTKENADALVEFLLMLAESKTDEERTDIIGNANNRTKEEESYKKENISTTDNTLKLEEKSEEFILKAIPIHPDELVTKLDLGKLTDDINSALNMCATKADVERLRVEVKERLDSLEDILKKIVAFQQEGK